MVKHTQTIRQFLPANRLSVCDHFMGLLLKGLKLEPLSKVLNVTNLLHAKSRI